MGLTPRCDEIGCGEVAVTERKVVFAVGFYCRPHAEEFDKEMKARRKKLYGF